MPARRALLAAALLSLAVGAAPTGPAGAAPAQRTAGATTYAVEAHAATNAARATQGLPSLTASTCLQRFARAQARRMAAKNVLYHQDLGPVMKQCRLSTAGENVALGYATGTSVVVDGWMNSEGHRANILGTSYRAEGIAAARGTDGRWWVAQVFGRKR